jgi:hypothetical protein
MEAASGRAWWPEIERGGGAGEWRKKVWDRGEETLV